MSGKDTIIATFELDDEKKQNITRYAVEKLLKEIKVSMSKHRKIRVTIEKA